MLCTKCSEREATIHEVVIKNGKKIEKHLCERCAAAAGLMGATGVGAETLAQLMASQLAAKQDVVEDVVEEQPACPSCGLRFDEFKKSGLLGCGMCYSAFEAELGPLLERAHESNAHHVGKIPKHALTSARQSPDAAAASLVGSGEEIAERIAGLRRQLERAVAGEQYERAAEIRDEIKRVSAMGERASEGEE